MYVIFKVVSGFYYYAKIVGNNIIWYGITDNATIYTNKKTARIKAEYYNLNPDQINKV